VNHENVMQRSSMYSKVQCPHCHRVFAEQASLRHIPICANIRNKPKTLEEKKKVPQPAIPQKTGGRGMNASLDNSSLNMSIETKPSSYRPTTAAVHSKPKQAQAPFCTSCGSKFRDKDRFCGHCGLKR